MPRKASCAALASVAGQTRPTLSVAASLGIASSTTPSKTRNVFFISVSFLGEPSPMRLRPAPCRPVRFAKTKLCSLLPRIHKLPPKPPFDAEVAVGDVVIQGRGDFHDLFVLHVDGQGAAHAAIGTDGVGRGLAGLVPGAGLAHVVLALEHQRAGGTDADAVAAVDAGRVG